MHVFRATIAALLLIAGQPVVAQPADVKDAAALKPEADVMRNSWKMQPNKPIALSMPLFGRIMQVKLSVGFVPAHRAQNQSGFIYEFVPDGDDIERWTQLFTITSMRGIGSFQMDDGALAASVSGSSTGCSGTPTFKIIRPAIVVGGATGVVTEKRCSGVTAGSYVGAVEGSEEHNLIVFLRDADNVFTVQFARRGKGGASGEPLISPQETEAFLKQIEPILLCERASILPGCRELLAINAMREGPTKR